jgi:hypothetical protein
MRRDVPSQAEDELVPVTKQLYPIRLHTRAFLSYLCLRPRATSVCGLKLLVYEAFSY